MGRSSVRDKFLLNLVPKEIWETYYDTEDDKYFLKYENREIKRHYKISVCTTVMNRLEAIKETLEKNILDNREYPNFEFVLLDYNSTDGLNKWVRENLREYIDSGILNYYRTESHKFYSMTHSRNIAFRCAAGQIVINVDADHFTTNNFLIRVNFLANQTDDKIILVKSKQKNRGRIGMFKQDFLNLGGYNEDLIHYGYDDKDLVCRALKSGFKIMRIGGEYFGLASGHVRHPTDNYPNDDWKFTQRRNAIVSLINVASDKLIANQGRNWGSATLTKNFREVFKM